MLEQKVGNLLYFLHRSLFLLRYMQEADWFLEKLESFFQRVQLLVVLILILKEELKL